MHKTPPLLNNSHVYMIMNINRHRHHPVFRLRQNGKGKQQINQKGHFSKREVEVFSFDVKARKVI